MSKLTRQDCVNALKTSGLSEVDAIQTVSDMLERKKLLAADANLVHGTAALRDAIKAEFDGARVDAATRRRQAAISIMRRTELETFITQVVDMGGTYMDAIESILVGNADRFFGARASIDANRSAIFATFVNQLEQGIAQTAERHGTSKQALFGRMAKDAEFRKNFVQERMHPGSVDDAMIRDMVDVYDRLSETMRLRLNAAGADVRRLRGRLPQSHDQGKLLDTALGGKKGWLDFVMGIIDVDRTFYGRSMDEAGIRESLGHVYDTIATGRNFEVNEVTPPPLRSPRNIANEIGQHRFLHFKDANAYLAYTERYGRPNLWESIVGEMEGTARRLSLIESLGPNPEHMIRTLLENEKANIRRKVETGALDHNTAKAQTDAIDSAYTRGTVAGGSIAHWLAVLTGETLSPVSVGMAKGFGIARSVQSMAKLGGATLSAVADVFTKAISMRVNGANFLERHARPFLDLVRRYDQNDARILNDIGMYFDLFTGDVLHRFDQADTVPGRISAVMNGFFKYSGLTAWTERQKAGMAQWLSIQLGESKHLGFDAMHPDLRAMLEYHGFDATRWDIVRSTMMEEYNGKSYFNPALARNLTDDQLAHLFSDQLKERPRMFVEEWEALKESIIAEQSNKRDLAKQQADAKHNEQLRLWREGREKALQEAKERRLAERDKEYEKTFSEWERAREMAIKDLKAEQELPEDLKWKNRPLRPKIESDNNLLPEIYKWESRPRIEGSNREKYEQQLRLWREGREKALQEAKERRLAERDKEYEKTFSEWERERDIIIGTLEALELPEHLKWKNRPLLPEIESDSKLLPEKYKWENSPQKAEIEPQPPIELPEKPMWDKATWHTARRNEADRLRTKLETQARAFFADETKFAVIDPDAKTTAVMTLGTRPGTLPGEGLRTILQFKSFPIAFWQRTIAGKRWQRGSAQGADVTGMVEYMLSAMVYGYIAMSLKDLASNRTPRDPRKLETWFSAALQSGGAGIYGDFLLGKASNFGNGPLETLAGPLAGEVSKAVTGAQHLMRGEVEKARDTGVRLVMGNTPFVNLWYTKAALDWLVLDRVRESMSPGYKRRMLKNREQEYGQTQLINW